MSEIEGGCAIWHHLYHPYPKSKQMQLSRMPHRTPWTPGLLLPSKTGSCFSDSKLSLTPFDPCFLHLWSECVVLCCSPFINFTVSKMKFYFLPTVKTSSFLLQDFWEFPEAQPGMSFTKPLSSSLLTLLPSFCLCAHETDPLVTLPGLGERTRPCSQPYSFSDNRLLRVLSIYLKRGVSGTHKGHFSPYQQQSPSPITKRRGGEILSSPSLRHPPLPATGWMTVRTHFMVSAISPCPTPSHHIGKGVAWSPWLREDNHNCVQSKGLGLSHRQSKKQQTLSSELSQPFLSPGVWRGSVCHHLVTLSPTNTSWTIQLLHLQGTNNYFQP